MIRKLIVTGIVIPALITGCGKKDDERTHEAYTGDSSMVEDASLSQEAIEGSVSDAMASLSDSNETAGTQALLLAGQEVNKDKIATRTCEKKDDGSVAVVVSRTLDRSQTRTFPRFTSERSVTGSHDMERIWTASDLTLDCTPADTVNVDWKSDVSGLKLVANVKRSLDTNVTITGAAGRTRSRSSSFSAEGKREVEWLTSTEADDKITRDKTLKSTMTRIMKVSNSKGAEKDMTLTVLTKDDAPLAISVVRAANDLALQSKTIKSGTMIASRDGDGRAESKFEDLTMTFASGACTLASGKVTTSFFKEGSDTAERRYELTLVDGVATLTDLDSGEAIEDFDLPGCSFSDYGF